MQPVAKNLLKTFVIATVAAVAFNCAYYVYVVRNLAIDYQDIVTKISRATLLLTVILSIMTLPVLFLLNISYWNMLVLRVALYFSGPVVFIAAVLIVHSNPANRIFDLITGITFICTHSVFYYLTAKYKPGNSKLEKKRKH